MIILLFGPILLLFGVLKLIKSSNFYSEDPTGAIILFFFGIILTCGCVGVLIRERILHVKNKKEEKDFFGRNF